jgi:hypothetical protein
LILKRHKTETMKREETQETISSVETIAEDSKNKNFLQEYELINDSFPDEDPQ